MDSSTINDIQNCPIKCPKDLTKKIFVKDKQNYRLLFTIGKKAGESLWRDVQPNGDILAYNPFFDPCLKNFFLRKGVRKHLLKSNLITDKNEILYTLKEYNDYRQLLHRVRAENDRVKRNAEDEKELLKKRIKISDDVYMRIDKRNKKFSETYGEATNIKCLKRNPVRYENIVRNLKCKKLERECQRRQKFMEDVKKYNERIFKINQMNHLKRNEMLERGLYRTMEMIKKQIYVIEKQRERESKINQKICSRFEAYEERKKVFNKPEIITRIIKCPHE